MPDGTLVTLHRVTQLDHDPYASPCTRIGSRSRRCPAQTVRRCAAPGCERPRARASASGRDYV